jgi:hypothetical protein
MELCGHADVVPSHENLMIDRPTTPRSQGDRNAPHMSPATPAEDARTLMLNRISWGAVFAGVVIALVTQLIGLGVGVATLDPAAGAGDNPSATSLSLGAGIWFVVAGVIAAFAAMPRREKRKAAP